MKKITRGIIACAAVCVLACAFAAAGCGENTPETKTYTVTFDCNYAGASIYAVQTVEEGKAASRPADPVRDGYAFDNWYTTSSCTLPVDFTSVITADATYYAGWEKTVISCTVTVNIDGNILTYAVNSGETISLETPSKDNAIFSGWYADEECTVAFDLSAPVTYDLTIYAGWTSLDIPEGNIAVFFMTNDGSGSTYHVGYAEAYDKIFDVPTPVREGYRFMGWHANDDGTGDQIVYGSYVGGDNITVYASWYYGYVMEAEYTDLTDEYGMDREFFGYSNNYVGAGAILENSSCSNGKYVQAGNQAGKYLIFEVTCATDVPDAYLTITASTNYAYSTKESTCYDGDSIGSVSISSSQYQITVFSENDLADGEDPAEHEGTPLRYDTMMFDVSGLTINDLNVPCTFLTYSIGGISLSAGTNYIMLLTTSDASYKSEGGQTTAKSPNLDCITIYSTASSGLSQVIYQS